MSSGKKFVALSLMTFIVIIVLGAVWGHHSPADTTGPGVQQPRQLSEDHDQRAGVAGGHQRARVATPATSACRSTSPGR